MINQTPYVLTYQLKAGTSTSYYLRYGESILPSRISIAFDEFTAIQSRKLPELKVGQMKGRFKVLEVSPYSRGNREIHTTIWKPENNFNGAIIGTGDLQNTSCLLIFEKTDQPDIINIHLYPDGKFNKSQILPYINKNRPKHLSA